MHRQGEKLRSLANRVRCAEPERKSLGRTFPPPHHAICSTPQEAARKAAAAAAAARFRADVAGQLEEKEAARLAGLKEKRAELVRMMADLEVS